MNTLLSPPKIQTVDDTLSADAAYRLACDGVTMLWKGDFHQGRQMVQSLARRVDKAREKSLEKAAAKSNKKKSALSDKPVHTAPTSSEVFYGHRQAQAQRARILGLVVVELEADYSLNLRRAPDMREACTQAWGAAEHGRTVSLRELMGVVAAFEWRKKGVEIPALSALGDGRIYPHYGVFSPVRGEYVDLVAQAAVQRRKLGSFDTAFDIGTGTGVLAAVLASRGAEQVTATDQDPRSVACAVDNMQRMGLSKQVSIAQTDLFPAGRADVVVCNPPWLPGKPASPLEHAVYDDASRMLRGFLSGLAAHLNEGGEGWLIMSDLAEHLGLRAQGELAGLVAAAGLTVAGQLEAQPLHPKAQDASDPLHAARSKETTRLWRLVV